MRNGTKIPIHGGPAVGEFNVTHFDPKAGYVGVLHGSSYVQVVRVTGGCPNVHTVQTYSQSVDPTSPYSQTKMYFAKQWMRWPFCTRPDRP